MPPDVWADRDATTWVAAEYAACVMEGGEPDNRFVDATTALGKLRAPAQALLRGKQQTYHTTAGTFGLGPPNDALGEGRECFALTLDDYAALVTYHRGDSNEWFLSADGSKTLLRWWISPVMPHGERLIWRG